MQIQLQSQTTISHWIRTGCGQNLWHHSVAALSLLQQSLCDELLEGSSGCLYQSYRKRMKVWINPTYQPQLFTCWTRERLTFVLFGHFTESWTTQQSFSPQASTRWINEDMFSWCTCVHNRSRFYQEPRPADGRRAIYWPLSDRKVHLPNVDSEHLFISFPSSLSLLLTYAYTCTYIHTHFGRNTLSCGRLVRRAH